MTTNSPSPNQNKPTEKPESQEEVPHEEQTEDYGGGFIKSRHGWINIWLLVVYLVLIAWGVYYAFEYWGGLGPGLDY